MYLYPSKGIFDLYRCISSKNVDSFLSLGLRLLARVTCCPCRCSFLATSFVVRLVSLLFSSTLYSSVCETIIDVAL